MTIHSTIYLIFHYLPQQYREINSKREGNDNNIPQRCPSFSNRQYGITIPHGNKKMSGQEQPYVYGAHSLERRRDIYIMRNNKKNIGYIDTAIEYPESNEISANSAKVVIYTRQHVIYISCALYIMDTVFFNI